MSYKAIITKIHTRPHPKADRLQIGTCSGFQVLVGLDIQDQQLGIYFPTDGTLSHFMAHHNNLYRSGEGINKNLSTTGYLDSNRRIRCLTLRGAASEGLWLPLESLLWTGVDIAELSEGTFVTKLNNHLICEKYFALATRDAQGANKLKNKVVKFSVPMFKQHNDTEQLSYFINSIPSGSRIIITSKLHGTSGRTGKVLVQTKLDSWKTKVNQLMVWLNKPNIFEPKSNWHTITGSRNVTYSPFELNQNSYREKISSCLTLHKGETLYYEIVGYDGLKPIMGSHTLKDKDDIRKTLAKLYKEPIVYSYGCEPGQYKVFVYRITTTNEDSITTELSWEQVKARCLELGISYVPELWNGTFTSAEELLDLAKSFSDKPDSIDSRHPTEGVCIRVEHQDMFARIFKYKGFVFKYLEGISKDLNLIDLEEIS